MGMLGIITGTIGRDFSLFDHSEERVMKTVYGQTIVLIAHNCAVIPRHGRNRHQHILPHLINHQTNMKTLKDLGVDEVIAVNSTGSLKKSLKPGTLVVPDDFLLLDGGPTVFSKEAVHITPTIDENVRQKLIQAAHDCYNPVVDGGIYWQTKGPRLETKAEITMMARFAHLVGMTMASEAIIAKELGIPYASLCSVDNFAHGLDAKMLRQDEIARHARQNAEKAMRIVQKYIENRH